MWSDFPRSARRLLGDRFWTSFVILVAALGIGLTTATFSLVDAVLFRPLGIADQSRVVRIGTTGADRAWMSSNQWAAVEEYRGVGLLDGVEAEANVSTPFLSESDGTRRFISVRAVTGGYFSLLQVSALCGRTLTSVDDRFGASPAANVSLGFALGRFGSAANALGHDLTIGNRTFVIVGVLNESFWGMDVTPVDVWLPAKVSMSPTTVWSDPGYVAFEVFARLKDGVSIDQASAAVDAVAMRARGWGTGNDHAFAASVSRLSSKYRDADQIDVASLLSAGAVALLLLTSMSIASLFLVRLEARVGELALRAGMGASRPKLLLLVLIEPALLMSLAGIIATGVAKFLAFSSIHWGAASFILGIQEFQLSSSLRIAVVALASALFIGGLAVAVTHVRLGQISLSEQLKHGVDSTSNGHRGGKLARILIAMQIAVTVMLVVLGTALVGRYGALINTDLGFEASPYTLVLRLSFPEGTQEERDSIIRGILNKLQNEPRFRSASVGSMVPLTSASLVVDLSADSARVGQQYARAFYNPVSSSFLDAMGIPLVDGRGFTNSDTFEAPRVALVSEALADRFWGRETALGRVLRLGDSQSPVNVIGVVRNHKVQSATEPWRNMVYVPLNQREFGQIFNVLVRVSPSLSKTEARDQLDRLILSVDQRILTKSIQSLSDRVAAQRAGPQFLATAVGASAVLSLVLVAASTFALFQFLVSRRRSEFGIRLALGASKRDIFGLIIRESARIALFGLVFGFCLLPVFVLLVKEWHIVPSIYDFAYVPLAIALVGIASVISAVHAARQAARTNPAIAIGARYI